MQKPTIKDVATKANVSTSTVSLVLNGKGNISAKVRKIVVEAVKELGYRKNVYASAISKKHHTNIAILINEDYEKAFEWGLIRNMFIQLENIMTKKGYSPVFIPVSFNTKTSVIFEKVVSAGIGSLFSIHYGNIELFTLLEDYEIPVIVINNGDYQNKFFTICSDDFQGAYEGTFYLINKGHKHIAFFDYERPDFKTCQADRYIGFKKALDEANISLGTEYKRTVNLHDVDEIKLQLTKLLDSNISPTAIFAHDDYLAVRIIMILKLMHLKIPDDISIIAPGDTLDYNEIYIPKITTMQIDTKLLGKLAGELMIERLSHKIENVQFLKIKQQLVERDSVKTIN